MTRFGRILPWAALVLAAAALRLLTWEQVFTPDGVRFLFDSDTHYHVLRAERALHDFPRVATFDPWMNYPRGADIIWPPLFDFLIAAPAYAVGGTREALERVAAVIPVAFGILGIVAAVLLGGRIVGRRAAFLAGAILCALQVHVRYTDLGRPDQHAAELFLATWVFGAFIAGLRATTPRGRRVATFSFALATALAFWNWQGSAMYLVVVGAFVAAAHLALRREEPAAALALASGGAAATATIALSLLIVSPRSLLEFRTTGISALAPALTAASSVFAAVLWRFARPRAERPLSRRAGEIVVALLAAGAPLLLVPDLRAGVLVGATALARSNAWYAAIAEFQPLFFSRSWSLSTSANMMLGGYGLALAVMPFAGVILVRARRPETRDLPFWFLIFWGAIMFVGVLARTRFGPYAAIPMALWTAAALEHLGGRIGRRAFGGAALAGRALPVVGAALLLAPTLAYWSASKPHALEETLPALRWLSSIPPEPGREAVFADWPLGHLVQYYARRPVTTTPFGTEGGAGAMDDLATFLLAPDEETLARVLTSRRAGYVLLGDPMVGQEMALGLAPDPGPALVRFVPDLLDGPGYAPSDAYWRLPTTRLYHLDGSARPDLGIDALGRFRLLYESAPGGGIHHGGAFKLFEFARGAEIAIEGAPGPTVAATVAIQTNGGRHLTWIVVARTDRAGRAALRVPYATGRNGFVVAGPMRVESGTASTSVFVGPEDVAAGRVVRVALTPE